MNKSTKNCHMKKKLGLIMMISLLLILALNVTIYQSMEQKKANRSVVVLSQEEEKKIVFYKDDCPDCEKVFGQLYWHEIFYDDTVFVNLNQKRNRHYIQTYQIKSVPTIIHNHSRYEGIDRKKIRQVLQE